MFRKVLLLAACILCASAAYAQVDEDFRKDIIASGYVHKPLRLHEDKSVETAGIQKKVLHSELLCDMESLDGWTHDGIGTLSVTTDRAVEGTHSLRLEAPSMPEKMLGWGLGRGTCLATYDLHGVDWRPYNRLRFSIYPDCEGARTVYLNLYLENDGEVKVPDPYGREGYHEINLKNHQWNDCYLEFTGLERDKISCLKFAIEIFGRELTMGDTLRFDVDNVLLENVEDPEPVKGWQPADGRIIFSTTGYTTRMEKTALVTIPDAKRFKILNAKTGRTALRGKIRDVETPLGAFRMIDFSKLRKPGKYCIKVGEIKTWPFYIDDNVWDDSAWRLVNFLFCERCGYPVPDLHGACHADLHATYKGKVYPLHGGWHDAGDMSQQTVQSAEISYACFQAAQRALAKGNTDLYNRLMEEGLWGMDYVLRSRLGDGFRAMSWGTNLWTDGILDTEDDAGRREIRVHDGALENFLFAGIEAYTSQILPDDPEMAANLVKVAREDYDFALARFDSLGFAELSQMNRAGGHTRMTSESQYHANMSWAASMLYQITGEKRYADDAARFIEYTLQCQQTEPVGGGLRGFFYRDTDRRSTVHYNHQSRSYAYMEALEALLATQPDHPDRDRWMEAVRLYGQYLKDLMAYIEPYGMMPSGVYHKDEVRDSANFYAWQVGIRRGADADYAEMMRNGVQLDEEHYLRKFPVWFSFKGNTACSLSDGKAAAICARLLGDEELRRIAEKQLEWVVGYNPFGQSLIYGEGSNWCQLYNALPGERVGEIPVGMQSYFNEDQPYWPQFNTATYKEVWGGTAVKWLMLIAEF
ncbi:MAG: glycoside hydrolase family 9 protein [Bacteroidales bacterium]|nr:glycoside hydrolase family 9 protein [Bacteroidales bacterium]